MANQVTLNRCRILLLPEESLIIDKPMHVNDGASDEQQGVLKKFRVTTTDELDFLFGLVEWPEARPEVRAVEMLDGLTKYKRLLDAGRLSLIPISGDKWIGEINVMKFNGRDRQTLNRPTYQELDYLAGEDAVEKLIAEGVLQVGTREQLTGDQSNKRNSLAIEVNRGDVQAIATAFTLTRVMAVMFDLGLKHE